MVIVDAVKAELANMDDSRLEAVEDSEALATLMIALI